jgi:hypothetical protein
MRKNLITMYEDEERRLNEKMRALYALFKGNLRRFNDIFQSELKPDAVSTLPDKALRIFKVFFRCQLPFEMFVSCPH